MTGYKGVVFTKDKLHTDVARFRVNPLAATDSFAACANAFRLYDIDGKTLANKCPSANQYRTPFVGVLLTEFTVSGVARQAGTTGTAAGTFTSNTNLSGGAQTGLPPQIKWDAGETFQAPLR